MISKNSTLLEIYNRPIGHDVLAKILMIINVNPEKIKSFPFRHIKLKYLRPFLGKDLINSLVDLVNIEEASIKDTSKEISKKWWKEAVFYQIYPRSFCDSNGDGIGDLQGIISKLDYIKDLGVDCIWLSPVYDSPMDDNGYDIRNYRKILDEMGTMENFDLLLKEVHDRGMKLIMDLVVNHTSDEHKWFKKALDGDIKYQNYYIFADKPNNWKSWFSGTAWRYFPQVGKYGLHLFSQKQMDLNWENKDVRKEVIDICKWYFDKGVDGFRLDVINLISKRPGLPNGNEKIGDLVNFTGIEHYFYGAKLYQYIQELVEEAFKPYGAFSVGETPGHGIEMGRLLTNETRNAMDLVFSFDHLETPGHNRFDDYKYDLNFLKDIIYKFNDRLTLGDWQAIYLENHDNPRMPSKVIHNFKYRDVLSKMLLGLIMTVKGTPFIYQGQELGSLNLDFKDMSQIRDVESINMYQELLDKGISSEEAFASILAGSRDHARNMINWYDNPHENAWIDDFTLGDGYSVKDQIGDKNSVLSFFKDLNKFRKTHIELIYGAFNPLERDKKDLMVFTRGFDDKKLLIEINLSEKPIERYLRNKEALFSNYVEKEGKLKPYELNIYRI